MNGSTAPPVFSNPHETQQETNPVSGNTNRTKYPPMHKENQYRSVAVVVAVCSMILMDITMALWLFMQIVQRPDIVSLTASEKDLIVSPTGYPTSSLTPTPQKARSIAESHLDLGLSIVKAQISAGTENLNISPLATGILFGALYDYGDNSTQSRISSLLNLTDSQQISSISAQVNHTLAKADPSFTFQLSRAIYVYPKIQLTRQFTAHAQSS